MDNTRDILDYITGIGNGPEVKCIPLLLQCYYYYMRTRPTQRLLVVFLQLLVMARCYPNLKVRSFSSGKSVV